MSKGLFVGIVEGASAAAAVQWRDKDLAAAVEGKPGVRATARFTLFNLPKALLCADLGDFGRFDPALPRPPGGIGFGLYRARQVSEMRQPGSSDDPLTMPILYTVRFAVPQAWQAEFDDWYETEHIPMALGSPFWTITRRYRFEADEPHWTHLAVHFLADARAIQSPQMKAARLTPWRNKFATEPWFQASDRMIALQDA